MKIGDLVYKHFTPVKCGKVKNIKEVVRNGIKFRLCEVAWIDGTISSTYEDYLKDFNKLIADHERKLKTHKDKLPKLNAL